MSSLATPRETHQTKLQVVDPRLPINSLIIRGERRSQSGIDGSAGRQHYERLVADMIRDPRLLANQSWKGVGKGEDRSVQHESDTERGTGVPGIERCATSSRLR